MSESEGSEPVDASDNGHAPSLKFNCYDGYRSRTVHKRHADGSFGELLSLVVFSDGKELLSAPVSHQPDSLEGRAALSRLHVLLNAVASYLNCCGSPEELRTLLEAITPVAEQARITPPPDWQFMQCLAETNLDQHQYLFLNEGTGMVLVMVPDTYSEEVTLEAVQHELEAE